jgi:hypothetical protein
MATTCNGPAQDLQTSNATKPSNGSSGADPNDAANDGFPAGLANTVVASGAQLGPYEIEAQIGAAAWARSTAP